MFVFDPYQRRFLFVSDINSIKEPFFLFELDLFKVLAAYEGLK